LPRPSGVLSSRRARRQFSARCKNRGVRSNSVCGAAKLGADGPARRSGSVSQAWCTRPDRQDKALRRELLADSGSGHRANASPSVACPLQISPRKLTMGAPVVLGAPTVSDRLAAAMPPAGPSTYPKPNHGGSVTGHACRTAARRNCTDHRPECGVPDGDPLQFRWPIEKSLPLSGKTEGALDGVIAALKLARFTSRHGCLVLSRVIYGVMWTFP
jgi:hypothetical protein